MAQTRDYATKKKGKTEVQPFWNMEDIKNVIEWFEKNEEWDGYLITLLELLLGRRIGDTVMMKWSDLYYENGNRKSEIDTIEEQKTGKIRDKNEDKMLRVIEIEYVKFPWWKFWKKRKYVEEYHLEVM